MAEGAGGESVERQSGRVAGAVQFDGPARSAIVN